jgi:hypothetical protein
VKSGGKTTRNLLKEDWKKLDSAELRLLLRKHIPGGGQYDSPTKTLDKLYLPVAGESCRIVLDYRHNKIEAITPGDAFNGSQWKEISSDIDKSVVNEPVKIGRDYSFSSLRVSGSWRGERSKVQILPPPEDAPRAPVEMADHPFILEFPIVASDYWPLTNYRRRREHRNLTLLLNILLPGGASLQPIRPRHFWANVSRKDNLWAYISRRDTPFRSEWVQEHFFAELGKPVIDELSPATGNLLSVTGSGEDDEKFAGDGTALYVLDGLDDSIIRYSELSQPNKERFNRATFWVDMASRQWTLSVSASFASLVSAIESLTDMGTTHSVYCEKCDRERAHDVPGATEKFRTILEELAPGPDLRVSRNTMYSLRSGILHGSQLMQIDQDLAVDSAPAWWNEHKLTVELWALTRIALRNWLKNQPRK